MDNRDFENLQKRISEIEQSIKHLKDAIERINNALNIQIKPEPKPEPPPPLIKPLPTEPKPAPPISQPIAPPPQVQPYIKPTAPAPKKWTLPEQMKKGEYWLLRVGIALILFGIAFLFKYSIDQGWLTPWIRVAFGIAVGIILLFFGFRIYNKRRPFAITLLGAALGTWYITGFSAYQLLELVTHTQAFGFMIVVTLTAFVLSIKQDQAILSVIAVLGGFGTPFLLYSSSGNLPGLVIYTVVLSLASLAIYFFKGWRSLLWLSSVSNWLVLFIGIAFSIPDRDVEAFNTRAIVQSALAVSWIFIWLVPIFRELVHIKNPKNWHPTLLGFFDNKVSASFKDFLDRHLHVLSLTSILFAFSLSLLVWPDLESEKWGWIAFGLCLVYSLATFLIGKVEQFKTLKYTHLLISFSLFNLAIVLILDGNVLLFSLATEAMILGMLSSRLNDNVLSVVSNIIYAATFFWMLFRLVKFPWDYHPDGFFDGQTMTDLWVIITYFVAVIKLQSVDLKRLFGAAGLFLLTLLFIQELDGNLEKFVISVEAAIVFIFARIYYDISLKVFTHLLFATAGYLLFFDLTGTNNAELSVLNRLTLTELWTVLMALTVFAIEENKITRRFYLLGSLLVIIAVTIREFTMNWEYAILIAEAAALVYFTKSARDRFLSYYSYSFYFLLALWLVQRFIQLGIGTDNAAILNWDAATNLWFIVSLAFMSKFISDDFIKTTFRYLAHITFLTWLGIELSRLENGQGWFSVSWGIYAIIILIIGLRTNIQRLRLVGLGTLMLLVIKLFLVDLSELETIWRVLLFIGFGGIFLTLSYFFRSLWKSDKKSISSD